MLKFLFSGVQFKFARSLKLQSFCQRKKEIKKRFLTLESDYTKEIVKAIQEKSISRTDSFTRIVYITKYCIKVEVAKKAKILYQFAMAGKGVQSFSTWHTMYLNLAGKF